MLLIVLILGGDRKCSMSLNLIALVRTEDTKNVTAAFQHLEVSLKIIMPKIIRLKQAGMLENFIMKTGCITFQIISLCSKPLLVTLLMPPSSTLLTSPA